MSREVAAHIRSMLDDPADLCEKLGLVKGSQRQHGGVLIRCPAHGERTPSCSVTLGKDRTIRVKCFACDFSGDALTLIAVCRGLNMRTEFRSVLGLAAQLGGDLALADQLDQGVDVPTTIARPEPARQRVFDVGDRSYPLRVDVDALWADSVELSRDGETVKMLHSRGLDFGALCDLGLGKVISKRVRLPRWARYRGSTWFQSGHRLLLQSFDANGEPLSVRAWRVCDGDSPKRLPPAGHKQAGLVQANREAVQMLKGEVCPKRLWVVEGEPDFLSVCWRRSGDAVIGIGSGGWTIDHARKVPVNAEVMLSTHIDRAGEKYAADVLETLSNRCVMRLKETA